MRLRDRPRMPPTCEKPLCERLSRFEGVETKELDDVSTPEPNGTTAAAELLAGFVQPVLKHTAHHDDLHFFRGFQAVPRRPGFPVAAADEPDRQRGLLAARVHHRDVRKTRGHRRGTLLHEVAPQDFPVR